MQFNKAVTVIFNEYNDFGEAEEASRKPMKCCVLAERLGDRNEENSRRKAYDLKIMVPNKVFSPYRHLFTDETIRCEYDGRLFRPIVISCIKDFRGNTKFFEIEFEQEKK